MGLTGLIWSGFVLTHMLGNMLIFVGAQQYNSYSHALISNPFIYLAEIFLLVTILAHAYYGIRLTIQNKMARNEKPSLPTHGTKAARFQSKWMIFHGSLLLVFIILHIITFKYGTVYSVSYNGVEMRDIHRLVIEIFHSPGYVAWYVFSMVIVGLHLSHGFYSSFASLGFYHPTYSRWLSKFGYVYALIIALGFMSQPIYVYFFAS
jgi:succinate dehydrogenase / fumarate reductase cytochrome b subunit